METQVCPKCRRSLPREAYSPSQWRDRKWCRECKRAYMRARYEQDPEPTRAANRDWSRRNADKKRAATEAWRRTDAGKRSRMKLQLRHRFGLTVEEYEEMATRGCWACGAMPTPEHEWSRPLHVDHDHVTGETRGLLCRPCNTALGLLGEDRDRILGLARYVEEVCHPLTAGAV